MLGNELFWSSHIRHVFIEKTRNLSEVLVERILKVFDNIEQEAKELTEKEYERLLHTPVGGDRCPGMDEVADIAQEKGIDWYLTMRDLRQGLINIFTVAVYGLFTQHLMILHRKQLLEIYEENDQGLFTICEVKKRFSKDGIDIEKFSSWGKIVELGCVANVVKHAEGQAADKLRKMRPDLFDPLRGTPFDSPNWPLSKGTVFEPLFGQDVYVHLDDMNSYTNAIVGFWEELATILEVRPKEKSED